MSYDSRMDRLEITGGNRLHGKVVISGAKNAALPDIAASILTSGKSSLTRVPDLMDVRTMGKIISNLGAEFLHDKENSSASIDTSSVKNFEAPYDLVKTMRASVLVLGPLLARYGRARVSLPGGCAIGARPVNLHISALKKMGAEIEIEGGYIIAKAKRLKGAHVCFDTVTVTGTENIMMAAALAKGNTLIENSAREPEVLDLADVLTKMGAKIYGAGDSTIEIEGVAELKPFHHKVIPDRIEAGTFMAIAGVTNGDIVLEGINPADLESVLSKLGETSITFEKTAEGLRVKGSKRLKSADVRTSPFPGFPTDMQAQFMAMMCIAEGASTIVETIFENRLMHVAELRRMGADINVQGGTATVRGIKSLKPADVMATDLRASASLVIAGLSTKGRTVIHRVYHLDRGYERMDEKLRKLGAHIIRTKE